MTGEEIVGTLVGVDFIDPLRCSRVYNISNIVRSFCTVDYHYRSTGQGSWRLIQRVLAADEAGSSQTDRAQWRDQGNAELNVQ